MASIMKKSQEMHNFSSPHFQNIQRQDQFLDEIKNQILQKSKTDVWKLKSEPNFDNYPYVDWRRGDSCCAIM
ncbi:hypothetical protein pb186bvf_001899 [Paramecium bursaria]